MDEFTYNPKGSVYKCLHLDEILKLNIVPERVKTEIKEKFGKTCHFYDGEKTKIGKVIGLEINTKLANSYYILKDPNKSSEYFIPINQSITLL